MTALGVRNRTSEFNTLLQAARTTTATHAPPPPGSAPSSITSSAPHPPHISPSNTHPTSSVAGRRSEFATRAAVIGKDIASTSTKLEKLTKLAQRRSLFDDQTTEIQELTFVIKQDIAALNANLETLAALQAAQRRSTSKQAGDHSGSVVDALKKRLVHTASDFKDVLKMRTDSLQAQQNRRSHFTGAETSRQNSSANEVALDLGAPDPAQSASSDLSNDTHRGPADFRMQMQQARPENTYLQARADAVRQVESTIAELGQIFNQLATMVSQQGEMVERIDANVEDTLVNMEEGQNQLMQYYNSVSSNQGLILKSLGVFFFFLILWIFLA